MIIFHSYSSFKLFLFFLLAEIDELSIYYAPFRSYLKLVDFLFSRRARLGIILRWFY